MEGGLNSHYLLNNSQYKINITGRAAEQVFSFVTYITVAFS